jgi:2-oxoisovalerate dehydrogenase E1 component alpha subunit
MLWRKKDISHFLIKIMSNMETLSYLNENGDLSKNCPCHISNELLLKGYRTMLLTRHIDERMVILQRQGTITFAMTSAGEEACAVATASALQLEDWIYPQYREVGVIFWRGFTPKQYVHHMFCDSCDLIHGRQMPNHFGSRALNVVQVSSPIGTKIPHAAGAAYGMKLKKEKSVAVSFFGEGATSEGDFHVGLNFAAVRKAPAIFFCRNNGYAISTPCRQQFASEGIAPKGIGYGIKTERVDGNDFFAVYDAISRARVNCLQGEGPVLIEAMTCRLGAHSTSDDPTLYRGEEEVESWKCKDPILRLRKYLEKQKLWDNDKEQELVKSITVEIDDAIIEAKACAKPNLHTLVEHVYFDVPSKLEQQYQEIKSFSQE